MGAHIAGDQDLGRERTVREFISEFRGLSGSAKQKAVLDEVGAARSSLANYFGAGVIDHAANARLLAACQKHTRPVKPGDLGVIGKQHLEAIFVAAGAAPKSFEYRRTLGVQNGLPWVAESAFGIVETGLPIRRLISGVNWSVATGSTPFRSFGRHVESLDSLLTDLRAGRDEPVIALIHLANPRIDYTDRGKSAVNLGDADDDKSRFADRLVETIVGAVLRGE
jgi:hypothetical protein